MLNKRTRVEELADILSDRGEGALAQTQEEWLRAVRHMAATGDREAQVYLELAGFIDRPNPDNK